MTELNHYDKIISDREQMNLANKTPIWVISETGRKL